MTPQDFTNRAAWSRFLEAHTARRLANPPTPKSGQRASRSAAPSPQPQIVANGARSAAAD